MGVLKTERNSGKTSALAQFTQGIDVDRRLAAQEVQVQSAWARALGRKAKRSLAWVKSTVVVVDSGS